MCSRAPGRANGRRQKRVRGREEIMARCPGSEKVRATVASAIQGSSSGALSRQSGRPGDARVQRLRARCWRLPWTEPDSVVMQGSRGRYGRLSWACSSMAIAGMGWEQSCTVPAVPDPAAEAIGNGSNSSAVLYLVHTRLRLVPARTLQRIRPTAVAQRSRTPAAIGAFQGWLLCGTSHAMVQCLAWLRPFGM